MSRFLTDFHTKIASSVRYLKEKCEYLFKERGNQCIMSDFKREERPWAWSTQWSLIVHSLPVTLWGWQLSLVSFCIGHPGILLNPLKFKGIEVVWITEVFFLWMNFPRIYFRLSEKWEAVSVTHPLLLFKWITSPLITWHITAHQDAEPRVFLLW